MDKNNNLSENFHECQEKEKFCVVCGTYCNEKKLRKVSICAKELYEKVYGSNLPEGPHVPTKICITCFSNLRKFHKKMINNLVVKKPMMWGEPVIQGKVKKCYCCDTQKPNGRKRARYAIPPAIDFRLPRKVYAKKGRKPLEDENLDEVKVKSEVHEESNDRIALRGSNFEMNFEEKDEEAPEQDRRRVKYEKDVDFKPPRSRVLEIDEISPKLYTQNELELKFRQDKANLTVMRSTIRDLKKKKLTVQGVSFANILKSIAECKEFFKYDATHKFVYCKDIKMVMNRIFGEFNENNWRFFADGTQGFLIICLLHNTNKLPSVPLVFSKIAVETYERMKRMLEAISFENYSMKFCGDLKMMGLLRGKMLGNPHHPCIFYCLWPSRDTSVHYKQKLFDVHPTPTVKTSQKEMKSKFKNLNMSS